MCIQFPMQLGYAVTVHKIQGANIRLPNTLTTDFSGIFEGSQYYTVISRVNTLDGLFILNDVYENKIYTSKKALDALKELEGRAINADLLVEDKIISK